MRAGVIAVAGLLIDGVSANDGVAEEATDTAVPRPAEAAAADPGRLIETGTAKLRVPLGRPLVAVARTVPPKRLGCGPKAAAAAPVSSPASRPANMAPPDGDCPTVDEAAAAVRSWET